MKFNIEFSDVAWGEYLFWQQEDRKTLKRINKIINDIKRHPFEGIGKPEPLKHSLQGTWSRRIDEVNRIVYIPKENIIQIIQVKYRNE